MNNTPNDISKDIQSIRNKKKDLSQSITQLINDFTFTTGLTIESIDLTQINRFNLGIKEYIVDLTINI